MICGNCQQEARRVTVKFNPDREECEHCADGGLHHDPAWMRHKPVPRFESHPNEYTKITEADGSVLMMPTDESRADLEAQVCAVSADDQAAIDAMKNRPARPIDLGKAEFVAKQFLTHFKEVTDEYERANAEYWNTAADDLKVQ